MRQDAGYNHMASDADSLQQLSTASGLPADPVVLAERNATKQLTAHSHLESLGDQQDAAHACVGQVEKDPLVPMCSVMMPVLLPLA